MKIAVNILLIIISIGMFSCKQSQKMCTQPVDIQWNDHVFASADSTAIDIVKEKEPENIPVESQKKVATNNAKSERFDVQIQKVRLNEVEENLETKDKVSQEKQVSKSKTHRVLKPKSKAGTIVVLIFLGLISLFVYVVSTFRIGC